MTTVPAGHDLTRRSLIRALTAGAGLAATSVALSACGSPRLEVSHRWDDCGYFALQERDGRVALVGWSARSLRPRVVADLGQHVIGWQLCRTPTGALVGWVREGGNTRFTVVDRSRSAVTTLPAELDTGAYAVVGDTVQVVTPGPAPTVASYDRRLRTTIATTDLGSMTVTAVRGTPQGGAVLGADRSGEVVVVEVAERGSQARTWRTGVRGLPADVTRVGPRTVVSVVRDASLGASSRSCLVVGGPGRPVRILDGWTRPGAVVAVGNGQVAVEDSRGTGRVLVRVDAASAAVVAEQPLASAQSVLGLAASGGSVMVLQQDRITLIGEDGRQATQGVIGLLPGQW